MQRLPLPSRSEKPVKENIDVLPAQLKRDNLLITKRFPLAGRGLTGISLGRRKICFRMREEKNIFAAASYSGETANREEESRS
jgi:hypothetical protein